MTTKRSIGGAARRLRALLHTCASEAPRDYRHLRIASLPRGGALAYCEFGDPLGTPMLCLHGLSFSGLVFEQYDGCFTELGVRAIAPCLAGGIYLPDPAATIDTLSAQVLALLDVLGIARFDMIGFSWGTLVQLALLARAPQRIRRAGLVGPMTPLSFIDPRDVALLKPDVRMTLRMAGRAPLLHRALMALVCQLPLPALADQFKDAQLSAPEAAALETGTPFHTELLRCMGECLRTGSQFFTLAWRMFLDRPAYALADLRAARHADVRLYAAANDNVHLPRFAQLIAAACSGQGVDEVGRHMGQRQPAAPGYVPVFRHGGCTLLMLEGAGRMACMLHLRDALADLMAAPDALAAAV